MRRVALFVAVSAALLVGAGWSLPASGQGPSAPQAFRVTVCKGTKTLALPLSRAASEVRKGARAGSCARPARSLAVFVQQLADISVTKVVSGAVSGTASTLSYQIGIRNLGTDPALSIMVNDTFVYQFFRGTLDIGPGSGPNTFCSPPIEATGTATLACIVPTLGPGEVVTVSIGAACNASQTPFRVTNTASAIAGAGGDEITTNNFAQRVVVNCNPAGTTSVRVLGLSARATKRSITVSWRTAAEVDTLGFDLWRTGAGATRKINRSLIRSKGAGGVGGARYALADASARRGGSYTYRLQAVQLDGTRRWLGSVRARAKS